MNKQIVTTGEVLSSVVEMLQEHIAEAPNPGIMDGIQIVGDALNEAVVAVGGSTDRPIKLQLIVVEG